MANSQRRMIYSKIWTSQQFGKLHSNAKLLFIGMITLADDDGRLVGDPSYLRGQIFSYDYEMAIQDVISMREEIEKAGLIEVYKVGEFEYIQHPNWEEYQVIRGDLYKKSTLPNRNGTVTKSLRKRDVSKDKISKDKISKDNTMSESESVDFETVWKIYPLKVSKKKASDKWSRLSLDIQNKILADLAVRVDHHAPWKKDRGKYVPHFITYLNGERWNDEIVKEIDAPMAYKNAGKNTMIEKMHAKTIR